VSSLDRTTGALVLLGGASILYGQAIPTASRAGDAQIGVGYSLAGQTTSRRTSRVSPLTPTSPRPHFGVEAEFHQIDNTAGYQSFQRTYEFGGRYLRSYGPLVTLHQAMIGHGQFEYPMARPRPATLLCRRELARTSTGAASGSRGIRVPEVDQLPTEASLRRLVTIACTTHLA